MPVVASEFVEAIAHLPSGGALRFDDVPWEEYEALLEELGDDGGVRIFYDRGRMEIMSPSTPHEVAKTIINRLVNALADELDIDVESCGSTTYRLQWKSKGAEPDDSFFIQNAAAIIGRHEQYNLEHDPPPDLVVETEHSSASLDKFPIYAAFGVPEIWRERKQVIHFYMLRDESYVETSRSKSFPMLDSTTMSQFLVLGLAEGSRKAARAFRSWVREHRDNA